MDSMTIWGITFDATDPVALAAWWARHTGGTLAPDQDGEHVLVQTAGPALCFQRVADPTPGKNRLHLDLTVADRERARAALLADGATLVAEHTEEGYSWSVLDDPQGNRFCIGELDPDS